MKSITSLIFLALWVSGAQLVAGAESPQVYDLWPGAAPDDNAAKIGPEKYIELNVNGKPYQVGGKPTKWLTNVTKPAMIVYRPDASRNNHVAMIICPGGGYHNLGWDIEGEEVAAWLNSIGMTGIILKYRCPRRPGEIMTEPPLGPLKDAQRAVSLVRSKAKEWDIDPQKIGMVGFSAGGHLVGATCTNFEHRAYEPIDDIDKVSCRPDFGVLCYSGYFKPKGQESLSPTIRTPQGIPPLFLVHATDDTISDVENTITMYVAMKRAGAPIEMHIYATGGHGFAVRHVGQPCENWTQSCIAWLRSEHILD